MSEDFRSPHQPVDGQIAIAILGRQLIRTTLTHQQLHQMHQMAIYRGVYTGETRPLKPIVSEVKRGGVSEESGGCLGRPIRVGPPE